MSTLSPELRGLEGYFLIPLAHGSKRPIPARWPSLRLTVADSAIAQHRGNFGLLLGGIYPHGGLLELDVDNPEDGPVVQDALARAGLFPDAVVKSGGEHDGWKFLFWLPPLAWEWNWPGKVAVAGCEVDIRGAGKQCVVPPSRVVRLYRWVVPLPPLDVLTARVADRAGDFAERLFRLLAGLPPESLNETHRTSDLPTELAGGLANFLDCLAQAGATFGPRGRGEGEHGSPIPADGVRRDSSDRIQCFVLYRCPYCGGRGRHGAGDFVAGRAHVTPAGRLKCKGATCKAWEEAGGLPASTWTRECHPGNTELHLLADSLEAVRRGWVYRDPTAGEYPPDAQNELAWVVADALDLAEQDGRTLPVVDATPGTGKTHALLELYVELALREHTSVLLQPRHDLLAETKAALQNRDWGQPSARGRPRVVLLEGRGRLCGRFGNRIDRVRHYSEEGSHRVCRRCQQVAGCRYWLQFAALAEPGTIVLAPHGMIGAVARRLPRCTPIAIDELPALLEATELPLLEIQRVLRAERRPLRFTEAERDAHLDWFACRQEAAKALQRLCQLAERGLEAKRYRTVATAPELLGRWTDSGATLEALARAVEFEPEGLHPSLRPGDLDEEEEAVGIRADFDQFAEAVKRAANGAADLSTGVPFAYRNPGGEVGLGLWRHGLAFPEGRPVVVLAAGATGLLPLLRRAWPDRTVNMQRIVAAEGGAVERWAVDSGVFDRRRLHDEEEATASLRHLAPELVKRAVRFARERRIDRKLSLGVIAPRPLADMLRAGLAEEVGTKALLDALELTGAVFDLSVDAVGHFGAVAGSNAWETVDCLLVLGTERMNLGDAHALAEALPDVVAEERITGEELVDLLGEEDALQHEGRARPIRRDSTSPLLIARVGRRLTFFDPDPAAGQVTPPTSGPPRSRCSLVGELVAEEMILALGWTAAPALRDHLLAPEPGKTRMAQGSFRISASCARVCDLVGECGTTLSTSRLAAAVRAAARSVGSTERKARNPEGTASWTVFELRPGAYEAWKAGLKAETVSTEPLTRVQVQESLHTRVRRVVRRESASVREFVNERAAIREHDGGQLPHKAEQGALEDLARYLEREHGLAGVAWTDFEVFERMGLFADVKSAAELPRGTVRGHARPPVTSYFGAACA